jgi:hypothetical protein
LAYRWWLLDNKFATLVQLEKDIRIYAFNQQGIHDKTLMDSWILENFSFLQINWQADL